MTNVRAARDAKVLPSLCLVFSPRHWRCIGFDPALWDALAKYAASQQVEPETIIREAVRAYLGDDA